MVLSVGVKPNVQLLANGADITGTVMSRFSGLHLTDGTGFESDELVIEFTDADTNNPLRKPPKGAELAAFMGYDGTFIYMGAFVVDEITMKGWPGTMAIRARSAVYAPTPAGKIGLQTQFVQTWADGTTIGALVETVAKRHGLSAQVSASLASIALPHINQDSESDLNLLSRIAQKYDAVFKPANGALLFYPRGTGQTVAGAPLPAVTLTPGDVATFEMTEQARETAGTAVAFYHVHHDATRHEISVGSGDPVRRLRMGFTNQAEALAAAKASLAKAERSQQVLRITMAGDPTITAEAPLSLRGFHPDLPTAWVITQVTHSLDKRQGYTCELEAQLPNDPSLASDEADTAQV